MYKRQVLEGWVGKVGDGAWQSDEALIRAFEEDNSRRVADASAALEAAEAAFCALWVWNLSLACASAKRSIQCLRAALR